MPFRKADVSNFQRFSSTRRGFTLVELLIVVAIIGILAAVAIPQFASYRSKAYCSKIKADLANLAINQEAYYYDYDTYVVVTRNADGSSNLPEFYWSEGVTLVSATGDKNAWAVMASHPNCETGPVTWDSNAGGMQ